VHDGRTLLYRASKRDCDVCPTRAKCCTNADARKIPCDLHEDARDVARRKMKTKAFARSRDERKRVEMRFAHLKTHHGFERKRLRGFRVRATSSISPPSCRTSRRSRSESSGRHRNGRPRWLHRSSKRRWGIHLNAAAHFVAAAIKGRIERHDNRIEAFFDSIGQGEKNSS
jgi:hypothetical protein